VGNTQRTRELKADRPLGNSRRRLKDNIKGMVSALGLDLSG
jgi:hypothetical protein